MIEKGEAEFHTQVQYYGTIWLTKYKGQDLFVTDMNLFNSVYRHFFDCDGNRVSIAEEDADMFYGDYSPHMNFIALYTNRVYF
jgi:hypothetical protein